MDEQIKNNLITQSLSEGLSSFYGLRKNVRELYREPFKGSSSFSTERVQAVLEDGQQVNIFFKDLNPKNLLEEARQIREAGLERSRRELFMYRKILAPLRMGTPRLYGYRWEPRQEIYWIFLEDAGPKRLSRLGDFSLWTRAAAWIARLHAIDNGKLSVLRDVLPRYDAEHFDMCALRIEEGSSKFDPEQQKTVFAALDRYHDMKKYFYSLPNCLIHGEYFGKNVMIRPGDPQNTIAVIDWETSAFGPRCVDLASITAGRWTPQQRKVMCEAYAREYEKETGKKIQMEDLSFELANVALYRAMWWLGYWSRGDDAHINRWMKELETVMKFLKFESLHTA